MTSYGRWTAAVLACGPGALLSHRSAAALWGLRADGRLRVDVTAPRSRHVRRGIDLHRTRRLEPADRAAIDGIPVTALARTLLDLAAVLPGHDVERVLERAEMRQLIDGTLVETIRRNAIGRRGARMLLRSLGAQNGPSLTRSQLERRFLALCTRHRLPAPHVNVIIEGLEVDAVWPDRRLVVELDGHAYHGTRAAFERDRERDAALQVAGYRVVRFTHRHLNHDPAKVIRTLRSLLA